MISKHKVVAGSPIIPTQNAERIQSLDVLRGFALLGILLANIQDFGFAGGILHDIPLEVVQGVGAHPWLDAATMVFQWLFVEGRMRALFGFLFGAGTVLLLERIEARAGAGQAADIFHRRNMWLLAVGLIHGTLIWNGDILFYYSLVALLLLYPLRHVQGRRLATVGFAIALLGGTLGIGNAFHIQTAWPTAFLQQRAVAAEAAHRPLSSAERDVTKAAVTLRQKEIQDFHNNIASERVSYLRSEPGNAAGDLGFMNVVIPSGWVFEVMGIMIAGMGMYKLGFLSAQWPSRTYASIAIAGYAVSSAVTLIGLDHARRCDFSDAVTTVWMFLPYGLGQIPCMLANASVLLLLIRNQRLMPMQRALASVGRTALTNYLLTSLICQFVFKWGPWKLYGQLEYYQQVYVVAAVWGFNIAFSRIWLTIFAFGPFEWVWRSLTYWQRQRFLALPEI
jgi:uncharacterized protein